MKTKIYKNFKYHSSGALGNTNAYYRCKESNCGGKLSYEEGFEIKENQKHSCVEIEENIFLASICINSKFKNRKSTSYSIFINNGNGNEQFIGTQEIGEECKEYPIPFGLEQIEIKIKWINVNLNLDDFNDELVERLFYFNDTKYLKNNYRLILDLDNMNGNYEWKLFSKKTNQINKFTDLAKREVLIYKNSHFMGYLEKKNYQSNKDKKGKNKNRL
ncbi:unnamed protein product [Meloidogyne enterolobii]|uniref:Uncharacterized protein n=1 Tax=Meloidogyne enterolobii TaxID=390850 RepID=A0ACB0YSR3_MELEN